GLPACDGARSAPEQPAISREELPDVGGCSALPLRIGRTTMHPIADVADLYLVRVDGRGVCIDSQEGIALWRSHVARLSSGAALQSNPMPGDDVASNPMPGDQASNPIPGSNPMPGTNPSGTSSDDDPSKNP